MMTVSLVIRTLNEEKNILKCLTCIAQQTVVPDEIIIVDNESTDNTRALIKSFDTVIPLRVISNPIRNYVSGLNLGVQHSQGEIVGFLSADCFPEKGWLEGLLRLMHQGQCEVVFGTEILEGDSDVNYVINCTNQKPPEDGKAMYFYNSNILYRKKTLKNFLPFEGLGEFQEMEDVALSIVYARAGLQVMKSGSSLVIHNAYESMDDFKRKVYFHGKVLWLVFEKYPTYPRIYLSPFYWSGIECLYFFKFWNLQFLVVGSVRLIYTLKGIVSANIP